MITQQLQWDDVQNTLQAIDRLRNADRLVLGGGGGDQWIVLATDDDGFTLASGDLSERGLNFGIKRVAGHDENDGHVLVDERQRTVLEFSSENTYGHKYKNRVS